MKKKTYRAIALEDFQFLHSGKEKYIYPYHPRVAL